MDNFLTFFLIKINIPFTYNFSICTFMKIIMSLNQTDVIVSHGKKLRIYSDWMLIACCHWLIVNACKFVRSNKPNICCGAGCLYKKYKSECWMYTLYETWFVGFLSCSVVVKHLLTPIWVIFTAICLEGFVAIISHHQLYVEVTAALLIAFNL